MGHMNDDPIDGRENEVTDNSVPEMSTGSQNEAVRDFPTDDAFAAASSLLGATVTVPQTLLPDEKGKEDVPIPYVGTSTDQNNSGNYGAFSLPSSPSKFDLHELAQNHALEIIDGSHLMSEEGLGLWIKHLQLKEQRTLSKLKYQ